MKLLSRLAFLIRPKCQYIFFFGVNLGKRKVSSWNSSIYLYGIPIITYEYARCHFHDANLQKANLQEANLKEAKKQSEKLITFVSKVETRGLFMKYLKICPKCHAKLNISADGKLQYCDICRYWTKAGTARLDSIMIYA
jgi:hypothetical protein